MYILKQRSPILSFTNLVNSTFIFKATTSSEIFPFSNFLMVSPSSWQFWEAYFENSWSILLAWYPYNFNKIDNRVSFRKKGCSPGGMQEICKRNEQNKILDSMITKIQELQKNWTPYGPHPTEKEMRNKDFNPLTVSFNLQE